MSERTRLLPEEAAEYIGCRYDKLLQMVRNKEIPHYRIGRRVFFTKEGLDNWISSMESMSVQNEVGLRMVR